MDGVDGVDGVDLVVWVDVVVLLVGVDVVVWVVTVFDTGEKQLCLRKSKAQLPGRLAELCFTPGKVAFLLCQRL